MGVVNKWYLHVNGLVSFADYCGCLEACIMVCVICTPMFTFEQVPCCASFRWLVCGLSRCA